MKRLDTRNIQIINRHSSVTMEMVRGSAIGPAGDRIKHLGDLCGYCLDAPDLIPTGAVNVARTSSGKLIDAGNGYASPAFSNRQF